MNSGRFWLLVGYQGSKNSFLGILMFVGALADGDLGFPEAYRTSV